jgi:hypothetical protein
VEEERAHALEVGSQTYAAEDAQDQAEDWRIVLIHSFSRMRWKPPWISIYTLDV